MVPAPILYIEDEADDVLFMQLAFGRVGFGAPLFAIDDGRKAIAFLSGEGDFADREKFPLPVAVLLDLNLPIYSGFEVLRWIRSQGPFEQLPVFVFSSSGRPEDRANAHELGATDYLLKPNSGNQFDAIAVRLKHAEKQPPQALD